MTSTPPRILLVEDDASLRMLLGEELEADGYQVESVGTCADATASAREDLPDLIVSDLRLPDQDGMVLLQRLRAEGHEVPFIIITAFGTVGQAVDALKAGADDFLTKPLSMDHLRLKVRRLLAHAAVINELERYKSQQQQATWHELVGESDVMASLRKQITQIAKSHAPVLVTGESGTGKELVARAIHRESERRDGPFLPVNCAGIPQELMESEFFGHEAGAFTGAKQARKGLFAEAVGGTLLLDEIGEMPIALQAKLLRVLQEQKVKPVGSDHEESVDVRIIAATHVDLLKAVAEGRFREDLYYRLETLMLVVPPLRERGDDIELLAVNFLAEAAARHGRGFMRLSEHASQILADYPFPGNVRELASAVERAVTFCDGDVIRPEHLPTRIRQRTTGAVDNVRGRPQGNLAEWPSLEQVQQAYVRDVIQAAEGNKRRAAQILGVNRRTLYRWLEEDRGPGNGLDEGTSL
ncbi:sigma-54-dependent transcriptional regulator [Marinobacter salicampi]|uniref:sigma-54-dependent transcriptional regulator n=1 Tax=Marinobacter salicampi TaxID=435907 RepID=UPI0014099BB2|nr:sigma-54 dependent transcriptional regulator [Marinobacter salicampi]